MKNQKTDKEILKSRWQNMKARCYNKNHKSFNLYGGRGIKVCTEWLSDFDAFYQWAITSGFDRELTIDRIDANGNYCPENCRWATWKEQGNNKRNNHLIDYNGKKQTMKQWAEELGINDTTISERIRRGENLQKIFSNVKLYKGFKKSEDGTCATEKRMKMNGEEKTVAQWAEEYGITKGCLQTRLNRDGVNLKEALLSSEDYKESRRDNNKFNKYFYDGKKRSISEIARMNSVCRKSLSIRLNKGQNLEDALKDLQHK